MFGLHKARKSDMILFVNTVAQQWITFQDWQALCLYIKQASCNIDLRKSAA